MKSFELNAIPVLQTNINRDTKSNSDRQKYIVFKPKYTFGSNTDSYEIYGDDLIIDGLWGLITDEDLLYFSSGLTGNLGGLIGQIKGS